MIFSSSATPTIQPPLPSPGRASQIIGFCAEKNIFVMIDETYVEFAPDINEITAVSLTREFTNSYDSARRIRNSTHPPGMRPGYGITGGTWNFSKNERKTGTMVSQQPGSPGRELMLQDKNLPPPDPGPHSLRTHPPAQSTGEYPHLQNLTRPYANFSPPENPEARP